MSEDLGVVTVGQRNQRRERGGTRWPLRELASVILGWSSGVGLAAAAGPYHADANQLANRLHHALFVREVGDHQVGLDALDPPLVERTQRFLQGDSHHHLIRVLGDAERASIESWAPSTLHRVLLQHDVWAVFDWLVAAQEGMEWVGRTGPEEWTPRRKQLALRLARLMDRLAVSAASLSELPNNYRSALGQFAPDFDPQRPEIPYLPPDLLATGSSWVELAGFPAPVHTIDLGGRELFRVFVRLPGGQAATRQYLQVLRMADEAGKVSAVARQLPPRSMDDLPTFPIGTEFALVRQLLAIDDAGQLRVTPLVAAVQIRVHDRVPVWGQRAPLGPAQQDQRYFEFTLSRAKLLAQQAGGLSPTRKDDLPWISLLRRHTTMPDPIERHGASARSRTPILSQCAHCHREPNVHAFESYLQGNMRAGRPISLLPREPGQPLSEPLRWKRAQYSWGLYQGLRDRPTPAADARR